MAEPKVPAEIRAATTDRLLILFAQLTHKIHAAQQVQAGRRDGSVDVALKSETNLREQRNIIKVEIIRRCDRVR